MKRSIRFFTYVVLSLSFFTTQAQLPTPYKKGSEGQVLLWLNSSAYDHIGVRPYDYDNNVALGANDGSYKTYKTRTIGEYEWTSQNLFIEYANRMGTALAWANFDQNIINQMNQGFQGKDNVSLSDFLQINGSYVTLYPTGLSYRNSFKFYNQRNGTQLLDWDLPTSTDFFQMFGQAPAITSSPVTNVMNFLGANKADVPADYTADWFEYKNTSGFTMIPLGRRHSAEAGDKGQKWFNYKVESTFRLKDYPTGVILFNRSQGISIDPNLYHFGQARYSRAKTDDELGYKMYIDNCNDSVVMYPVAKTTNLTELPKGLERGIALRYSNKVRMKVYRKWSEIVAEAATIREAIPAIPAMKTLPVSPCEEPEVILPDPYQKGSEGQVLLWLNSSAYDHIGVRPYDYDNNIALGANDGSYKTYKTRTIGEYEWTSQNLFIEYVNRMGTALAWANFDQNIINQMNQGFQGKDNVSLSDFLQINGSYVSLYPTASSYRNSFKFYNQRNGTQLSDWDLPTSTDFFQMFGQAPAITSSPVTNVMNFLGANKVDVPADYTADWFEYKNTSGFTMTPLGRRHSAEAGDMGQKWFNYKVESTFRLKDYPTGVILFNRSQGVSINPYLYHFGQARYSRPKTDEELGYKMYIDNCNDAVVMYPLTKETNFTELPKGLERGIALRYSNKSQMKVLKKWSEIQAEATTIRQAIPDIPPMQALPVSPCEDPIDPTDPIDGIDPITPLDPPGDICNNEPDILNFEYDLSGNRTEKIIPLITTRSTETPQVFLDEVDMQKIIIYPNPTRGQLRVEIQQSDAIKSGNLTVLSMTGQTIVRKAINQSQIDLDISHSPSGTYVLQININGKTSTWKIIKQ